MRVLVVGGTGFVGPPVVRRLSNLGHAVTVFHSGRHEAALPFGVRHVHAAGAASPIAEYPAELTELAWDVVLAMNLIGEKDAALLMRTFRGVARRVVALSSGDVYRAYGVLRGVEAGLPDPVPLAEDAPLRVTLHPYRGAAGLPPELSDYEKISVERAVLGDPDLPGTVLRLPAVWGPGDRLGRFTSAWRRIADRRASIVIGRSHAGWRWTHGYVDDVAEAVVLAVLRERAKGKIYNVGESRTPTTAERLESFVRACGAPVRVDVVPDDRVPPHLALALRFDQDLVYDTSRIRSDLDWKETASADEALRLAAAWEAERSAAPPGPSPSHSVDEYAAEDDAIRYADGRAIAAATRERSRSDG